MALKGELHVHKDDLVLSSHVHFFAQLIKAVGSRWLKWQSHKLSSVDPLGNRKHKTPLLGV